MEQILWRNDLSIGSLSENNGISSEPESKNRKWRQHCPDSLMDGRLGDKRLGKDGGASLRLKQREGKNPKRKENKTNKQKSYTKDLSRGLQLEPHSNKMISEETFSYREKAPLGGHFTQGKKCFESILPTSHGASFKTHKVHIFYIKSAKYDKTQFW